MAVSWVDAEFVGTSEFAEGQSQKVILKIARLIAYTGMSVSSAKEPAAGACKL